MWLLHKGADYWNRETTIQRTSVNNSQNPSMICDTTSLSVPPKVGHTDSLSIQQNMYVVLTVTNRTTFNINLLCWHHATFKTFAKLYNERRGFFNYFLWTSAARLLNCENNIGNLQQHIPASISASLPCLFPRCSIPFPFPPRSPLCPLSMHLYESQATHYFKWITWCNMFIYIFPQATREKIRIRAMIWIEGLLTTSFHATVWTTHPPHVCICVRKLALALIFTN